MTVVKFCLQKSFTSTMFTQLRLTFVSLDSAFATDSDPRPKKAICRQSAANARGINCRISSSGRPWRGKAGSPWKRTRSPCTFPAVSRAAADQSESQRASISASPKLAHRYCGCVQSAGCQPPATDLWLNRFEPDAHRVVVDRPPSPVRSRWYSRWVLKRLVPSSSAGALVSCCYAAGKSIFPVHLTVCPQRCRSQVWASMRRMHACTHELACPQLVVSQGCVGRGAKPARSDLCLALWSRRCA
jgi:hypothetical protein